jgi:hypothetical protein
MYYSYIYIYIPVYICIYIYISDLGVILSLVGATGSTVVSYILPGAFYLSLYKKDLIAQENKEGKLINIIRKSAHPESGFSDNNNINKKILIFIIIKMMKILILKNIKIKNHMIGKFLQHFYYLQ